MSIEEIIKKTTIKFSRPLYREDAENLLFYLAEKLPANINSQFENHKDFIYNKEHKYVVKDEGTLKLTATINRSDIISSDTLVSKHCEEPWKEDISCISEASFQMVPGWELSDYRPEVRQLWDDVRTIVDKYFKEDIVTNPCLEE